MNKDEYYAQQMKDISVKHKGDKEAAHIYADQLLLDILTHELKFDKTVKEFILLEKYYS